MALKIELCQYSMLGTFAVIDGLKNKAFYELNVATNKVYNGLWKVDQNPVFEEDFRKWLADTFEEGEWDLSRSSENGKYPRVRGHTLYFKNVDNFSLVLLKWT